MCYLKERVMILLYIVISIDTIELWYPATDVPDTVGYHINASNILISTPSQIHGHLPLSASKFEKRTYNKSKWRFSENHNISKTQETFRNNISVIQQQTFSNTTPLQYQSHAPFENDVNYRGSNKTWTNRPKRKVLKRCPSVHPRQKKEDNTSQTRKSKFLEVFQVVQFEHVTCTSSTGLEGTCLHEIECETIGGTAMGSCADGYATCCVTQFACDGRSSSPVGWYTNPGFPTPSNERLSCTFALDKNSVDVQQIRLDFLNFELLPPSLGTCEDDQFVVTGQNTNHLVPILCGVNTGQHVYIEVGDVSGPIYFSVQTVSSEKRLFAIKITQLLKTNELAAPTGCLQYYKGDTGYLESFNYRDHSEFGIPRLPSYLNNMNYAMCLERSVESCSITYTNAGELQIPNYDTDGLPLIPPKQAGVEIFNCPSDWLLISAIRLCGERFNDGSLLQDFSLDAPVTDNGAGPPVLWFRSDGGYVGRGFKLYYLQNKCTVSS